MKISKERKIKYIVTLKDSFEMPLTTINKTFCGMLETVGNNSLYFRLNGSNALVIVPYNEIAWMAPSKVFWEQGCKYEDEF